MKQTNICRLSGDTMRAATVVQVLQDLFYVLLHVLFYMWSLLYFYRNQGRSDGAYIGVYTLPKSGQAR